MLTGHSEAVSFNVFEIQPNLKFSYVDMSKHDIKHFQILNNCQIENKIVAWYCVLRRELLRRISAIARTCTNVHSDGIQ